MTQASAQPDLFSLLDDPTFAPAPAAPLLHSPAPVRRGEVLIGWIKTYQGPALPAGSVTALPTLNYIANDGHRYQEAEFEMAACVTAEEYPGSFNLWGIRVKGEKNLISLYDAVQRDLAKVCRGGVASHA